jgi:hypothetical protein
LSAQQQERSGENSRSTGYRSRAVIVRVDYLNHRLVMQVPMDQGKHALDMLEHLTRNRSFKDSSSAVEVADAGLDQAVEYAARVSASYVAASQGVDRVS